MVTADDWRRSAEVFADLADPDVMDEMEHPHRPGPRATVLDHTAPIRLLGSVREAGRGQFALPPLALMPIEHLTPAIEDRAFEVQMLLADRGQHRAPSIPDLLIAATAEKTGLTVLAVDKDFDLIAAITGQPVETLAGA
jgi:predicted nucleic acid-binding protein